MLYKFYNETLKTFLKSNNIGYQKGDKLLVGMATSNTNLTGIKVLFPFSFYRYDQNGFCYYQTNNLSNIQDQDVNYSFSLKKTNLFIKKSVEFGVNAIFSCDLKKNLTELMNICLNFTMYNASLYTNFINYFQSIGIFANANPLFLQVTSFLINNLIKYSLKDWLNITAYIDISKVIWDNTNSIKTNKNYLNFYSRPMQLFLSKFINYLFENRHSL